MANNLLVRLLSQNNLTSLPSGLVLVSGENVTTAGAMLMEMTAAEFLTAHDCGLYTVGQLEERHYSFGVRRGSPLTRTFSHHLLQLVETGRVSRARDRWWPQQGHCDDNVKSGDIYNSLDLVMMGPPFIFLGIGLLLSCLLGLLEMVVSLRTRKISSLSRYLKQRLSSPPSSPVVRDGGVSHVATQTVLWASSRANTPAPGNRHF